MANIFNFSGIAKRQEYWAVVIGGLVPLVVGLMLVESSAVWGPLIALVLLIAYLWATIATSVRRIRDTGNNVAWIVLFFIPYISFVATIVFGCISSAKTDEVTV